MAISSSFWKKRYHMDRDPTSLLFATHSGKSGKAMPESSMKLLKGQSQTQAVTLWPSLKDLEFYNVQDSFSNA
jgi:hypothetical protein